MTLTRYRLKPGHNCTNESEGKLLKIIRGKFQVDKIYL